MPLRLRNPLKMLRSNAVALDMGSGRTRILSPEGEVLLDEPTVVALDPDGHVLAAGTEAKTYLGKAPERIRVVRPLEGGSIVDLDAAKQLLRHFLRRVLPDDGTRINACVVAGQGLSELERRTLADCIKSAGVSHADLVSSALAAAVGAGIDITQARGRLVLGIGASLAEASVICLSGVVHSEWAKCGARTFHEAVTRHLVASRQVAIGENTAEETTIRLACAAEPEAGRELTVTGKNALTGTPCALELASADLEGALSAPLEELEALVRGVMERAPTDLVADMTDTGLLLYGGGSLLCGLDRYLSRRIGLRVGVAQEAQLASAIGAAAALRPDLGFRKLLVR